MEKTTATDTNSASAAAALRADMEQLRKDFTTLREDAKRHSNEHVRASIDKAGDQLGKWGKEIEAHPVISITTALGIGLLLGKTLTR